MGIIIAYVSSAMVLIINSWSYYMFSQKIYINDYPMIIPGACVCLYSSKKNGKKKSKGIVMSKFFTIIFGTTAWLRIVYFLDK